MKRIGFLIILFSLIILLPAQHKEGKRYNQGMNKLMQLEKLRLIEELELDENTSVKIFHRKMQHIRKVEYLNEKKDSINKFLEEKVQTRNSNELNKYIDNYFTIDVEILNERQNFLNSLRDILSPQQIIKYIVFERKFREEIKSILMKERKKRNFKEE